MKLKFTAFILVLLTISVDTAYGQWDAQVSQYWKIKNYYNPSFVGGTRNVENALLHRRQWVGVTNAPNTSMASFNMPFELFDKQHGVGLLIMHETIGLFSNTTTNLQYAYKFDFKKGRILNIGIQAALASIDFDASKIHIPESHYHDQTDPSVLPTGGSDRAFDGGIGLSWVTPSYYVGLSVSHIWEPKFDIDDQHSSYMGRTYYLMGGYNIKLLHPLLEFQPSILVKSDAIVTQLDLTAKMEYARMFSGGLSWRKDDGFIFLLGLRIGNIDGGYSYDLSTSAISKVSSGSHEIFLRYVFPLKPKKQRGKYRSVRIL